MSKEIKNVRVAGGYNKTFIPHFSQYYTLPQPVKQRYPTMNITYKSPAFIKEDQSFTTEQEMLTYLQQITKNSPIATLKIIGQSVEKRAIPLVVCSESELFSAGFHEKPTVLLQGEIHGNEPAAGEAALIIADQLINGSLRKEVLPHINVVIVPRINPDSSYYFERLSIGQINGNRDHLNFEMDEVRLLHEVFEQFSPEVVIDAHEYGAVPQYDDLGKSGALKYHDVLLLTGKNLNIPKEIREKSDEWFVQDAFAALKRRKYSYGSYYTVKKSTGQQPTLLEGGTDPSIGRNNFGLKPSFSILVETLGIGIGRQNFLRRVDGQVTAHQSLLKTAARRAVDIKRIIERAEQKIIKYGSKKDNNGMVVLRSNRTKVENYVTKGIDIATGQTIDIPAIYYNSTKSVATLKRQRPDAYIFPPSYKAIANKLKTHGLNIVRLTEQYNLPVQYYQVIKREVMNEGHRPLSLLTTEILSDKRFFPKGSFVVPSGQNRGLIAALALEPESMASYFAQGFLPSYVSQELPVYRYIGFLDFPMIE